MAAHRFNSVRLPICVESLVKNIEPNPRLFNQVENRAFDASSYMSLLKNLIIALAYRNISIVISMHWLTQADKGSLWFNKEISEATVHYNYIHIYVFHYLKANTKMRHLFMDQYTSSCIVLIRGGPLDDEPLQVRFRKIKKMRTHVEISFTHKNALLKAIIIYTLS
jgi:hypothetical protein